MALGILATAANVILILSVSINSIWCLEVNVEVTVSLSRGAVEALGSYLPALNGSGSSGGSLDPDLEDQLAVKLSHMCQTLPNCKNSAVTGVEDYILEINDAIEDLVLREFKKLKEISKYKSE
ncbi:hypothetical protein JYU34_010816 [Plutella xylostella]|uniref:Uncharacterized protein n=1 Tax=Plutella xylostella TaxID=51655 RepID=A0ABQ7QG21_PLUXY|nr:hypothetical protein JYU34_010816 [Plutella xylostella]